MPSARKIKEHAQFYSYSLQVFIYATYKINEQKTNKKYGHKGKNEKWPIKPTSHQKNQVPNKSVNNKQHIYAQMIVIRNEEEKNGIYSDIKVENYD